ncbi:MAG TPA: metalloregulator ArsR/SmtB family transcription factor [Acidimicrobiales bacterium]
MNPPAAPEARPSRSAPVTPDADAVLGALGDPTRRSLLQAVAEQGPLTATEMARPAGISRQAVSKHLAALERAGLVRSTRVGREARYEVVPGSLDPAAAWLDRVGATWDRRLTRLRRHLADDT